ncbi:MAG: S8 family serine peptidase [Saprospiraceae bacterium]|nr:S8 family serine peptidase [Saprospiraceae bacterium]
MRPLCTLLFLCLFGTLQAQSVDPTTLSPSLLQRITSDPQAEQDFYILLADRVDVVSMGQQFHQQRTPLKDRVYQVITSLQEKAHQTQGPILTYLNNHPEVTPGSIKPFWVNNVIYLSGSAKLIADLSHFPEIELLDWDSPVELVASTSESTLAPTFQPNGVEPGLDDINARAMWEKGYTGYGRISFTSDTGVNPEHPALSSKYRGIYASNDESFFTGVYPFDCEDHGTHVTGTIVGLDRMTNDTIGVAFNAQWIGAASIVCNYPGAGTIEAFQWALNPDGNINTIDDMPDVINNSWYNPNVDDDCVNSYVGVLNALDAAGVAVIFSAGNAGPGPMTITPPHNINTDLVNSFTVGALSGNTSTYPIADFSSRGPSVCGGVGSILIKPEVSAPGVSVRSCLPGGGYGLKSGTSMAAPHVSGAVLLLKEAFPDISGTDIKLALYFTCTDLGDPGEDNDYGMGLINVGAAFDYLVNQGFTPVDPSVALDLLLVNMESEDIFCHDELMQPEIVVENAGTETINSFKVQYYCNNGPTYSYDWSGILQPGERQIIQLPGQPIELNAVWIYAEVLDPNDQDEERPLNNKLRKAITVFDKDPLIAIPMETGAGSFCEDQPAFLRAETDGPGVPTFEWFDNPGTNSPVFVGDVFETPLLTEATTYYVNAFYSAKVGPGFTLGETDVIGGEADGEGLRFTAHVPFKLYSVLINAPTTGPRIIELREADGSLLATRFVQITEVGVSRVVLDINVPKGQNHVLIVGVGLPFAHNNTGANYPYEIENYVEITRSLTPFGTTTQGYYFFYDWEIEIDEPCGRTAIVVEPQGGGMAPDALFSVSAGEVNLGETVSFDNTTANASDWLWVFGDGATSTEENPSHAFNEPGLYTISLSASGADGCTDVAYQVVNVLAPISSVESQLFESMEITLFPNPANDQLVLEVQGELPAETNYLIYDALGKTISSGSVSAARTAFSIADLGNGFYFIEIRAGESQLVRKFVVQH